MEWARVDSQTLLMITGVPWARQRNARPMDSSFSFSLPSMTAAVDSELAPSSFCLNSLTDRHYQVLSSLTTDVTSLVTITDRKTSQGPVTIIRSLLNHYEFCWCIYALDPIWISNWNSNFITTEHLGSCSQNRNVAYNIELNITEVL